MPNNNAAYIPSTAHRSHGSPPYMFNPANEDKQHVRIEVDLPLYVEPEDAANMRRAVMDIGQRTGLSGDILAGDTDGTYVLILRGDVITLAKVG